MKTLFVFPAYEPAWAFGGTVSSNVSLCKALVKAGVDVVVYTTNADGKGGRLKVTLNKPIILDGVEVWYFNCDFGVKKAFYSRGLSNKLKETTKDFDLVHVSAMWQWMQVDVYNACKYFSKPYVVSSHGSFSPWSWNQNKIKKGAYWYLFEKKTIENAAALHFTAEDERIKSFANIPLLKKNSNFVVPNGIEINDIKKNKDIRKILNIPSNKIVLLFIGRIHKVKGIHFILQALKKVNNENFIFLIVGNKEDDAYANQLKKLSHEFYSNVIWHEQTPRDEVWDFYYAADLFVLPSYHENFSMVTVEAMSCGLPVMITRNVGIWREIQSDGAGIIVNQDADEIADAIKKLADDTELLNRMKQNARKSAEERYDINKAGAMMIKAYEDILTGRRSPELQWK